MLKKDQQILKGDRYKWVLYLYNDVEHGIITEANGKDFLQFTFAGTCLIEIKLREELEYLIIELNQKNIPEDDQS